MTRCCCIHIYVLVPHGKSGMRAINGQSREGEGRWAGSCLTSFEIRHWPASLPEWREVGTTGRQEIDKARCKKVKWGEDWRLRRMAGPQCFIFHPSHSENRRGSAQGTLIRPMPSCNSARGYMWCMLSVASAPYPGSPGLKIWPRDLPLLHILPWFSTVPPSKVRCRFFFTSFPFYCSLVILPCRAV
jgi:hypothetical protein